MPEPSIIIRLTTAEKAALLDSLEHDERGARRDDPEAMTRLALLDEVIERIRIARPARRASTRDAVEPFVPDTGDPDLDAWMRAHWSPADAAAAAKRAAAHIVNPRPLRPVRWTRDERATLGVFNSYAVRFWMDRGHEVIITGGQGIMGDGSNVTVKPLGVSA